MVFHQGLILFYLYSGHHQLETFLEGLLIFFASPALLFSAPFEVTISLATAQKVNETSFLVKTKKELDDRSIDEYESVRDFYEQYHNHLVEE